MAEIACFDCRFWGHTCWWYKCWFDDAGHPHPKEEGCFKEIEKENEND